MVVERSEVAAYLRETADALRCLRHTTRVDGHHAGRLKTALESLVYAAHLAEPNPWAAPGVRAVLTEDEKPIASVLERVFDTALRMRTGGWTESDSPELLEQWADMLDPSGGEYRPATWFRKGMAARLRMAAQPHRKTKRVRTRTIDGVVCYLVADARQWWPTDVPKEA